MNQWVVYHGALSNAYGTRQKTYLLSGQQNAIISSFSVIVGLFSEGHNDIVMADAEQSTWKLRRKLLATALK